MNDKVRHRSVNDDCRAQSTSPAPRPLRISIDRQERRGVQCGTFVTSHGRRARIRCAAHGIQERVHHFARVRRSAQNLPQRSWPRRQGGRFAHEQWKQPLIVLHEDGAVLQERTSVSFAM